MHKAVYYFCANSQNIRNTENRLLLLLLFCTQEYRTVKSKPVLWITSTKGFYHPASTSKTHTFISRNLNSLKKLYAVVMGFLNSLRIRFIMNHGICPRGLNGYEFNPDPVSDPSTLTSINLWNHQRIPGMAMYNDNTIPLSLSVFHH
ncbi:uncharacterized protein LOC123204541 [Mangifera indica]|uniref:uncharacterized protein LOC123204541 n=1 Tax=Mangifera indica TaxID=29780 RepID=UPI001CF978EA|nr:uncharacterized protein LOC123204541 [Mangifera indica]